MSQAKRVAPAPRRPRPEAEGPPSPPRTDPRMRARQVSVAREAGHRRLRLVGLLVGAVALVVGSLVLVHSSLFSARVLNLHGAAITTRAEVLAASGLSKDPPLIDIDAGQTARAIEALPFVQSANVALDWPDGVSVTLTERVAIAAEVVAPGRVLVFDQSGRVLAVMAKPTPGLVAVDLGLGQKMLPGAQLSPNDQQVLALAGALPVTVLPRIEDVARVGAYGLVAQLRGGPLVVFGIATDLREKMVSLATLLANGSISQAKVVDLRVPAAPVLTL